MSLLNKDQCVHSVAQHWRDHGADAARQLADAYQRELGYDAQRLMVRAASSGNDETPNWYSVPSYQLEKGRR